MFITNLKIYKPKNEYSQFIKEYFLSMSEVGTKKYIANIDIELKFIEIDNLLIPLSFGNKKENCYTVSFLSTLTYGKYELKNMGNIILIFLYKIFLNILIFFGKTIDADNTIYVNNILLSTNLYPDISAITLVKINNFIKYNYKNKIIVYRSLNNFNNNKIIKNLEEHGFRKIVSRQIFIFESKFSQEYKKIKVVKNDFRLIRKYGFKFLRVDTNDVKSILNLYNDLYLNKYTKLNPQFTNKYIECIININNFKFYKLVDKEKIIGVLGYFTFNNQATAPIFGYDTRYDKKYNLYSQISNFLTFKSLDSIDLLNSSSGAGNFKQARGAKKHLEYNYLFIPQYVTIYKKIYFSIFFFLSNKVLEKQLQNNTY